jgi:hypothetical protein
MTRPTSPVSSHDRVRTAIVERMVTAFNSKVEAGFTREAASRTVLAGTCAGPAAITEFQAAIMWGQP